MSALALLASAAMACSQPVYLTIDTGHMGVAPWVAEVLQRQQVRATFFLAAERTKTGGHSLDDEWAPWWKARAAEGHAFGSHTWAHDVWVRDLPNNAPRSGTTVQPAPQGGPSGRAKPDPLGAAMRFRNRDMTGAQYCAELNKPAERLRAMTGQAMAPIFRAPAGRTSPQLLAAAEQCGYRHVGWTPAGFLGDELDSAQYPNERLLQQALRQVKAGDILLMHLGIWSRQDAWAPAVLEPLILGLKRKGLCFATLPEHPRYGSHLP